MYVLVALLSSILLEATAISRIDFFTFETAQVSRLVQNDDDSSSGISLSVAYPFFGRTRSVIFVSALDLQCYNKLAVYN